MTSSENRFSHVLIICLIHRHFHLAIYAVCSNMGFVFSIEKPQTREEVLKFNPSSFALIQGLSQQD